MNDERDDRGRCEENALDPVDNVRFWDRRLRFEVGTEHIVWAALVGAALFFRLWGLGIRAMSHDESLHAHFSRLLFEAGTYSHDPMMHGPFLFYVNALVYGLFGVSDFTARLGPALAGTALVACLFSLRKELGRIGAFLAALMVTISPSLLMYSRYIRNDAYIALFSLLWMMAYHRYSRSGSERWLWLMTSAMSMAFITKENAFLFGAILGGHAVFEAVRAAWNKHETLFHRYAGLAVIMLSFVLPFIAPLGLAALGLNPLAPMQGAHIQTTWSILAGFVLMAVVLAAGEASLGLLRFRLWCGLFMFFWIVQVVFFSSFLANIPQGVFSGVVGSVGYWMAQHEVARGSQPWFYYLFLTALYEFFPFVAAWLGVVGLVRSRHAPATYILGDDPHENDDAYAFGWLLVWLIAGSYVLYTVAGEKMPWLFVHITLPLCLLAGQGVDWLIHVRCQRFVRGIALGIGILMACVWIRFSFLANITHLRAVNEPLVYAHGAEGVKESLAMLSLIKQNCRDVEAHGIAFDEETAWPMTWYRHDIEGSFYFGKILNDKARSACALVVGADTARELSEVLGNVYDQYQFSMIGWPSEFYKNWTWSNIKELFSDSQYRQDLLNWYWFRDSEKPEAYRPMVHSFSLFVRKKQYDESTP
ncbi:flippase activity-associated protein Agl23 [Desulfovibrio inopinatus]|uniref:flippase activity-associated protein Agl23 n=1 Tax=Desulfovibrio inopinatus TaxID=102109 RepID=UPI000409AB8F|nr:flippase activity-associated protein Agl23 [Desulfovibrio inopinatus]